MKLRLSIFHTNVVVDCGTNFAVPPEGNANLQDTTFMSILTYTCQTGYTILGISIRQCLASGQWSGAAPTCEGKSFLSLFFSNQVRHYIRGIFQPKLINLICRHWWVLLSQWWLQSTVQQHSRLFSMLVSGRIHAIRGWKHMQWYIRKLFVFFFPFFFSQCTASGLLAPTSRS